MVDAWRKARGGEDREEDDRRHLKRRTHLPRQQAPARLRRRSRNFGFRK